MIKPERECKNECEVLGDETLVAEETNQNVPNGGEDATVERGKTKGPSIFPKTHFQYARK